MSIDATRFVWKLSSKLVTASEKILLLSMADRANESHKCWPSQRRLEQDTCLNRKTIIKCIQSLEQKGLIMKCAEKKGRLNRINVYQLVGVPGRDDEPPIDEVPNSPKNTTFNSPNSGTFNSPNFGTQNLKEESKNKSIPPIVPQRGRGGSGGGTEKSKLKTRWQEDELFQLFINAYPRREKKACAWKAFRKLNPDLAFTEQLIKDVQLRCEYNWKGRDITKIPLPATYLNGAEWEGDILRPDPVAAEKPKTAYSKQMEALRSTLNAGR